MLVPQSLWTHMICAKFNKHECEAPSDGEELKVQEHGRGAGATVKC